MFPVLDYQAIRDDILRDISNQLPNASVADDSDYAARATATGAAIEGLYQYQSWIFRQIFADTADSDQLERHASLKDLQRKAATFASGTVTLYGPPGQDFPIGIEGKRADGVAYITTAAGTLDATGTATVAAVAEASGIASNCTQATALTLTAAPNGLQSNAVCVAATGGTDIETDASLLSRLLFVYRNPPCGGAAHDYYTWAMNVPGVTAAYVYPLRRGAGTVDVVIMTAGGIAGVDLLAKAQAYVDTQRPVQGDCQVLTYTPVMVSPAVALQLAQGISASATQTSIAAQWAAYFAALKPGDTVVASKLGGFVSNATGVTDYTMSAPAGNVTTLVDSGHVQLAVLGSVAWS